MSARLRPWAVGSAVWLTVFTRTVLTDCPAHLGAVASLACAIPVGLHMLRVDNPRWPDEAEENTDDRPMWTLDEIERDLSPFSAWILGDAPGDVALADPAPAQRAWWRFGGTAAKLRPYRGKRRAKAVAK